MNDLSEKCDAVLVHMWEERDDPERLRCRTARWSLTLTTDGWGTRAIVGCWLIAREGADLAALAEHHSVSIVEHMPRMVAVRMPLGKLFDFASDGDVMRLDPVAKRRLI